MQNLVLYFEGRNEQRGKSLASYTWLWADSCWLPPCSLNLWSEQRAMLRLALPVLGSTRGCSWDYSSCAVTRVWWGEWNWPQTPPAAPHMHAPPQWVHPDGQALNAEHRDSFSLCYLNTGRRKRKFSKSEAHYLFKLKRKMIKILLGGFLYSEKKVFKSQRKPQIKKQSKYLQFQSCLDFIL